MRREPTPGLAAQDLAQRFIRLGLVGFWQEAARAQAQSLAAQVDWPVVRGLAAAERLAPLLSFAVRDCPTAPPEVLRGCRRAYTNNARRNLYLLHDLEQLLAGLNAASVPVLVLKGVALIAGAYDGNIALRPLRDIDLLIHPAALPAALRAFDALGYLPADLEPLPGAAAAFESQRRMHRPGT